MTSSVSRRPTTSTQRKNITTTTTTTKESEETDTTTKAATIQAQAAGATTVKNGNGDLPDKYKKKQKGCSPLLLRRCSTSRPVFVIMTFFMIGFTKSLFYWSGILRQRKMVLAVTSPKFHPRILGFFPAPTTTTTTARDNNKKHRLVGYGRRVPKNAASSSSLSIASSRGGGGSGSALLGWKTQDAFVIYNATFLQTLYYHQDNNSHHRRHRRKVPFESFDEWTHSMADPMYEGDCAPMHDWQMTTFLTCNSIHEMDIRRHVEEEKAELVSNGHWRDVWVMKEEGEKTRFAMKTQRYEHDYEERNYDRHRRDAVSMERLSFSKFVVSQYQYCQNAGFSEYSQGGDLDIASTSVFPSHKNWFSSEEKVLIGYQVAQAMADLHSVGAIPVKLKKKKKKKNENEVHRKFAAAIAHTDISPNQFIKVGGMYKMNDFNRARFIRKNVKTGEACTFTVGSNKGSFRAPEEYRYDGENEMVDVYSMGNIFYTLIAEQDVFSHLSTKRARKYVMEGGRPDVPPHILDRANHDKGLAALIHAMKMCHYQEPNERFTAQQVAEFLKKVLVKNFKVNRPEYVVIKDRGEDEVEREYYG